ncbi:hypothetical protein LZ554_007747 [Drepanopeziza brunnea f. sp. 'monogermtubi']|nr:hypothetical protein LZ554_007747 [Drepanopeziza brunnea f. sp. 'monogermtubi']
MPAKKPRPRRSTADPAPQPRPRTHAFTGCLTCRERHVKCDLGQPTCRNCARLKVSCEGYSRKYSWMPPKMPEGRGRVSDTKSQPGVEESQTSRRVLFSDEEREAMALRMRDECCVNSSYLDLDRVLRELQEKVSEAGEFTRIGPFSIFPSCPPAKAPLPQGETSPIVEVVEQTERTQSPVPDLSLSPFPWGEIDGILHWDLDSALVPNAKTLVSADIDSNWETGIADSSLSFACDINDADMDLLPALGSKLDQCFGVNIEPTGAISHDPMSSQLKFLDAVPTILQMPNTENMSKIPPEARLLLDYYSSKIIDCLSMSPFQKPPWKTIHLPCAMSALAEIMVHGETRSLAKMALFYALLSISSFHVSCVNQESEEQSQHWKVRGAEHKNTAERFLRLALDKNLPKAKRGKYKEVLMSTLSMVTIGVFSGDMQNSHGYLAESEALIRTYGLPKPVKSIRISKLHHIFSYLRIIQETTSLRASNAASESSNSNERVADTQSETSLELSNNIAQSASSRVAWIEEEEEAEDLKEDPLFVSIYQLPSTLMSLLSQTSSLSKQLESADCSTPEFARRCQIIEDRIFKWKAPDDLSLTSHFGAGLSESPDAAAKEIVAHLVNATYLALVVHFQRQIRNTNPRVLQHYVTSAADHLLAHEQLKPSLKMSFAPFPWPGFIVGCEAYEGPARQKIDLYFKSLRSYNVGSVDAAGRVVREVWKRQDSGRHDHRWEDVLKDWGLQIVLT